MIRFLAFCLLLAAVPAAAAPLAHRPDGVELRTAAATVRVTALTNDILRVRIARAGRFDEDASWAVAADIRARHIAVAPTARCASASSPAVSSSRTRPASSSPPTPSIR